MPSYYGSYITYGPDANCTLQVCPITVSIYEYQPSIAANAILLALFGISLIICIAQSIKWRTWVFLSIMSFGYAAEMIGYGGRLMLHKNPFSFVGFIIQIVCLTIAPVFFTAVVYTMISKIVVYLGRDIGRFGPALYYWIFIPCDVVSLTLQATGGAMSSNSSGNDKTGVDISLAGLCFQVGTLTIFCALVADYALRWRKSPRSGTVLLGKFKVFCAFLALAVILILVRCCYRIDELSDGYHGPLIHDQGLFIGLEGVMVIAAAFCLNVAHPGPIFNDTRHPGDSGGSSQDTAMGNETMTEAKYNV